VQCSELFSFTRLGIGISIQPPPNVLFKWRSYWDYKENTTLSKISRKFNNAFGVF